MKRIGFTTGMVAAIQRDVNPKTQTRRIIRPQPAEGQGLLGMQGGFAIFRDGEPFEPKYQPGDILWIAEEHKVSLVEENGRYVAVSCEYRDGTRLTWQWKELPLNTLQNLRRRKTLGKWQRGRFLPEALAHIFLKVTAVRAEQVQDITEADAIAEGVHFYGYDDPDADDYKNYLHDTQSDDWGVLTARESFETLWQSIHGNENWNANPFVFAYTFERTEKPQ